MVIGLLNIAYPESPRCGRGITAGVRSRRFSKESTNGQRNKTFRPQLAGRVVSMSVSSKQTADDWRDWRSEVRSVVGDVGQSECLPLGASLYLVVDGHSSRKMTRMSEQWNATDNT
ncbi:hypothetical protein LSH36_355g01046 [Paralvinella palmiformis]|uniref:Uncharacterized protein n=1 Tax=Paralvinella palmiformis TaxID=53620 RepID=A0AAD9JEH6_9ANNE|nr:hypothetical protein LSH36_355g01046 [Paralvinella palmiformis]